MACQKALLASEGSAFHIICGWSLYALISLQLMCSRAEMRI